MLVRIFFALVRKFFPDDDNHGFIIHLKNQQLGLFTISFSAESLRRLKILRKNPDQLTFPSLLNIVKFSFAWLSS